MTTLPSGSIGVIREIRLPPRIADEGITVIDVPPPITAPIANAVWPPVPVYICAPNDSASTCPVKSIARPLLIANRPSSRAISRMSSVVLKS